MVAVGSDVFSFILSLSLLLSSLMLLSSLVATSSFLPQSTRKATIMTRRILFLSLGTCLSLLLAGAPGSQAFVPIQRRASHTPLASAATDESSGVVYKAPQQEIDRRRNLAIISHPDSGKTTMTEKLLLYGGALQQAGAVRQKVGRR